ncbi:hypothetical protein L249_5964 [Ophiocordyceps polyrhachis-furcata BCC 54312]|uniref:Uncharacterized protein n=1 Tax=Ophiocordyceps polyrhachis-furcata BCC 54312 TaxID=1330021 RepID=A0A367LIB5_9HYPO|nr:hypothetical protein L249_5964 [Ophiocordyceps polyrhachis-furcata BCC 54312]
MAPSAAPLDRAPGNTVGRSTRCTNSGHSARPRWSYQSYEPGFSHLIRDTNKLSTNFLPPSSSSTAPQNTLFDSTFPTLGLEQT